jgi:uncharacterized protein (TIGR00297 family)
VFEWLGAIESRWIPGFFTAVVVATGAFRARALTVSGALAATMTGGLIVSLAGWWPGVLLVTFFVPSSLLSALSSSRSKPGEQARGKRRDAVQVLANGGVPAACALAGALSGDPGPWSVTLACAIGGAAADTWATEIGRFNPSPPRLVTTWKSVPAGTSGAISLRGTLGGVGGSLAIGLAAALGAGLGWWTTPGESVQAMVVIVTTAGLAGAIADSLLGATVQATYRCPACDQATEQATHRCGTTTIPTGGWRWMTNDTVNVLAIMASATLGLAWSAVR